MCWLTEYRQQITQPNRCGVMRPLAGMSTNWTTGQTVERAIDDEVARVALLNVVDGGELSGKRAAGEAEAAGPIADAIAAADHLLVSEP